MSLLLIYTVFLTVTYKQICAISLTSTLPSIQTTDNRTLSDLNLQTDAVNGTKHSQTWFPTVDSGAAMRTFYVVAFAMATVVIYFVVRAVRLRRRKSKSRKYGVITSTSALEMEPLEKGEEDDDEDTTLFEVHHHNKYGQK